MKWDTLENRRNARKLTLMYKFKNGLINTIVDDRLVPTQRLTRGNDQKFYQPSARLDIYKKSYFPATIKQWNKLPAKIVHTSTPDDFNAKVLQQLRKRVINNKSPN